MIKQVEVKVDDIDQRTEAIKTLPFVIDGKAFEIDLSEQNLARFYRVLEPFTSVARTAQTKQAAPKRPSNASKSSKPRVRKSRAKKAAGPTPSQIREWAHRTGYPVGKAGRVSQAAREAFLAAHEQSLAVKDLKTTDENKTEDKALTTAA